MIVIKTILRCHELEQAVKEADAAEFFGLKTLWVTNKVVGRIFKFDQQKARRTNQ